MYLLFEVLVKKLEVRQFLGLFLIGEFERLNLVEGRLVIQLNCFDVFLQASILFFQYKTFILEKGQLVCEFGVILVPFDLDIDVPVSFLSEDQVVAHGFEYVHESSKEVLFLFEFEVGGEFI